MFDFFPYDKPIHTYKSQIDGIRQRMEAGELTVDLTGEENALSVVLEQLTELLRKYSDKQLELELRKKIHAHEKQLIERNKAGLPESKYLWIIADALRKKYFEHFPDARV